jgi:16S rRNA C1402 (ribose-2'-O) methylase RsmI
MRYVSEAMAVVTSIAFEENARGSQQEVYDHFNAKMVKGEIVIVVDGRK